MTRNSLHSRIAILKANRHWQVGQEESLGYLVLSSIHAARVRNRLWDR